MQSIVRTIHLDIKDFVHLSPQVKFLLVFQLIILFILSILIGVIFSPKFRTSIENQAGTPVVENPIEEKQNKLILQLDSTIMKVGDTQTVRVRYTGDPSDGVDTVITYIPSVFSVSNISASDVYDTILRRRIDTEKIYFSGARSPFSENQDEVEPDTSDYTVFTFDITALRTTDSAQLDFDPDQTIVAAKGKNILDTTEFVTIQVTSSDEKPSK